MSQTTTPDGAGRGHAPVRQCASAASSGIQHMHAPVVRRPQRQRQSDALRECARCHRDRRWCLLMFEATANFGHTGMRVIYAGHVPKAA